MPDAAGDAPLPADLAARVERDVKRVGNDAAHPNVGDLLREWASDLATARLPLPVNLANWASDVLSSAGSRDPRRRRDGIRLIEDLARDLAAARERAERAERERDETLYKYAVRCGQLRARADALAAALREALHAIRTPCDAKTQMALNVRALVVGDAALAASRAPAPEPTG